MTNFGSHFLDFLQMILFKHTIICLASQFILISQQQTCPMKITNSQYQNVKNRMRLIAQNKKILTQIEMFAEGVNKMEGAEQIIGGGEMTEAEREIRGEIGEQEKLMKKLRGRIELYRLERAKENVEYIMRQEDELKIMKKTMRKLEEEKEVVRRRVEDKNTKMLDVVPYQTYEASFNQQLMEVVHHNREQAASITSIERDIRKYHLLKKDLQLATSHPTIRPPTTTPEELEKEISHKTQQKAQAELKWKPHLDQLDQQHFSLLQQLHSKRELILQLEHEKTVWQTRLGAVRSPSSIQFTKDNLSLVKVDPKLRQKIKELKEAQAQKSKPKIDERKMQAEFAKSLAKSANAKQTEKEKEKKQDEEEQPKVEVKVGVVAKVKKDERLVETTHDDKNISKKVDKIDNKKVKTDQSLNTQMSFASNKKQLQKAAKPSPVKVPPKPVPEEKTVEKEQASPSKLKKANSINEEVPPSPTKELSPTKQPAPVPKNDESPKAKQQAPALRDTPRAARDQDAASRSTRSKPALSESPKKGGNERKIPMVLRLREVGVATDARHWTGRDE